MDHYFFTARSVTHAQQMERALAGIPVRIRRAGAGLSEHGCAYVLEVPERHYSRALRRLKQSGLRPVRIFAERSGVRREVLP